MLALLEEGHPHARFIDALRLTYGALPAEQLLSLYIPGILKRYTGGGHRGDRGETRGLSG